MSNMHEHFYLYAKGWYDDYATTNLIFDMKKLVAECTMTPAKFVTLEDVFSVLFDLVYKEMVNHNHPEYIFRKFVFGSMKTFDMLNIQPTAENERMIKCCLSVLRYSKVKLDTNNLNPKIFENEE